MNCRFCNGDLTFLGLDEKMRGRLIIQGYGSGPYKKCPHCGLWPRGKPTVASLQDNWIFVVWAICGLIGLICGILEVT